MKKKQYIADKIEEEVTLYKQYKENGSVVKIEKLEGFLRFESLGSEIIFQDKKMQKEAVPWLNNIFFTDACKIFYLRDESEGKYEYSYGMLATKSMANYLKLTVSNNVRLVEEGYFVTNIINSKYNKDINKPINRCIDYIKENNLSTRGNPFSKTIFYYKDKKIRETINQIIIPVNIG